MAKLKILNRYGVIPNELLNNPGVTLKAKGLYAYIQSKPEDWDFSVERIAKDCREGVDSVRSAVRELENARYLRRIKSKDKAGHFEIEYELSESPMENPYAVNPRTVAPATENASNNSKKEVSKKDLSNNTRETNTTIADSTKIESRFLMGTNKFGVLVCKLLDKDCRDYIKNFPEVMPVEMYRAFIEHWSKQDRFGIPRYIKKKNWILDSEIKIWFHEKKRGPVNIEFDIFWKEYGLMEQRQPCLKIWNHLSDKSRTEIMEDLPRYFASLRDPKFKRNPLRYLREEGWKDEREVKVTTPGAANNPIPDEYRMKKI